MCMHSTPAKDFSLRATTEKRSCISKVREAQTRQQPPLDSVESPEEAQACLLPTAAPPRPCNPVASPLP